MSICIIIQNHGVYYRSRGKDMSAKVAEELIQHLSLGIDSFTMECGDNPNRKHQFSAKVLANSVISYEILGK